MRIFVFGEEVTDDVTTSSVNAADDTRAPSTARFTVADKPSGSENGAFSRYVTNEPDIFALYPKDLNPVSVLLPDLMATLANDPALEALRLAAQLEKTREAQQAFLQGFTGSLNAARAILERGNAVTRKFASDTYTVAVESAASDIRAQIRERVTSIVDPVKRRVLLAKFDKTQKVSQPDLTETGDRVLTDARRAAYLKGEAFRYPFFAGQPIFHSNDPVRIAWRDPLNPRFWYWRFSGFISDWTVSRETEGAVMVTFVCEDVLRPLRYARIVTNPGIFDVNALKENEDFVTRTFFNDDFTRLSLAEIVYTLIFGPETPGTTDLLKQQGNLDTQTVQRIRGADDLEYIRYASNGGLSKQRVPAFGIGAFNFDRSATFVFGDTTTAPQAADNEPVVLELAAREIRLTGADALGVYQSVVDHQVQVSDLETMLLDGEAPTPRGALAPFDPYTGQPSIDAVIKEIGENPHRYPVDGGRVFILMPASLGSGTGRSVLANDFRGVETQTTFKSRLFVLLNLLERIEFSFYATPKGDILCEMPLYDFNPEHFGESPITYARVLDTTQGFNSDARRRLLQSAAREPAGPFAPHYRIAKRDTMDSGQTFTDEKMRTQFRTTWQNIQNLEGTETADAIGLQPEVVTLQSLIPQFGVRLEQAEPQVFIASKEAAQIYCHLKLNQWNAEALTSQIDMLPMLRLGPNRPIEISEVPYIASIRSVGQTLSWEGSDMSQTVGVNYTRVWDGLIDENKRPVYSTIGGAAGRPLNYAALFQITRPTESSKPRRTGDLLPDLARGSVG